MFFKVLQAEFIKLRTTRSFWGNTIFYLLMTLGFTAFSSFMFSMYATDTPGATMGPKEVASGITLAGALVLGIMAIIVVTNEYSQKYISMTFTATPNRIMVALAKLLMMLLIAATYSVVVMAIGIPLVRAIVGADAGANLSLSNHDVQQYLWKAPVYAMMFVFLTQGLAWLVRSAVVAIVIVLTWFMALEPIILPMLFKFGQKVAPYGPFKNLSAFLYGETIEPVPWDHWGSLAYFGVWALVVYVAGMALLVLRDA